jgi:hypothetical protein
VCFTIRIIRLLIHEAWFDSRDRSQINTSMRALLDKHPFLHTASVPWPTTDSPQVDWDLGVHLIENWLNQHIGSWLDAWAWSESHYSYHVGVGFRWEQDKTLFVLKWS